MPAPVPPSHTETLNPKQNYSANHAHEAVALVDP